MEQVGQISPEYAAGFFDGEGCLHVQIDKKGCYKTIVEITQRERVILDRIHSRMKNGKRKKIYVQT